MGAGYRCCRPNRAMSQAKATPSAPAHSPGWIEGCELYAAVRWGLAAAAITVKSPRATEPELSPAMLKQRAGI
jgi:hypothetical protein